MTGGRPPRSGDPSASPSEPASLLRRWGALIYEALLLFAIMLVAGFAILPFIGSEAPAAHTADRLYVLPMASRAFLFLVYVAVIGAYCIGFWTAGHRTLAMKTWGLSLQTSSGGPLAARAAIKRYLAAWIGPAAGLVAFAAVGRWGLLAGLINYYWAWLDGNSLFLHDRLAGTQIIRA